MVDDPEQQIWAHALAAETEHADAAEYYARRRAREAAVTGDRRRVALWEAVAARLHTLHDIARFGRPKR